MPALHPLLTAERGTSATPAGPVAIRATIDPRKDPAWERLVAGPQGSVFGSPVWISAIADTYGFDVAADVCIDPDGQPVAGLACTDVSDFRGVRQISLPFCDYLDPVLDSEDRWNELVGPRLARGLPLQLRVLEPGPPRHDPRFEHVGELMWHATDLERDQQEILAGFHPQARQNLRSARRCGVSVRFGTSLDDMLAFHELHRRVRKRKYRLLAQPASFFENIWQRFASIDAVTIGLASHDGVVIAGAVYLFWRDVMYYKFGASIAERLVVRPNELLAWESIRLGVTRGCRKYDWGVSDPAQPGLVRFKRKFATEEGRVTVLRHNPTGYSPADSTAAHTLGELTSLLTRDDVPDEVTQRAGEVLYRYFC
jgi:CelD/BcsL family acetyltransferase involved in cellulose biosynthesis